MKYRALLLCLALYAVTAAATAYSAIPAGPALLELPAEWSVAPLMAPTHTMGLRVSSFIINEREQNVRYWRQKHMANCRLSTADDDDWHCFDERQIYSLLWREEGFIWVLSERLEQSSSGSVQNPLPANLTGFDAQVLSHSETAFESVTLLHSRRSLYALQRDLLGLYSAQGARLLLHEQDVGGFIQQWQHLQERVTYTAQKDDQGDVLLVKVRGTNL